MVKSRHKPISILETDSPIRSSLGRWEQNSAYETTIQNADEAKCWLVSENTQTPIFLISGRQHLARALVALRAAGVEQEIWPYPVEDAGGPTNELHRRTLEFIKLLALRISSLAPWYNASVALHGRFANGCPGKN